MSGGYIHLGGFGEPLPENPADTLAEDALAEYAARAERRRYGEEKALLVTIRIEDPTDGSSFEMQSIGWPDLIRAIACLPNMKRKA